VQDRDDIISKLREELENAEAKAAAQEAENEALKRKGEGGAAELSDALKQLEALGKTLSTAQTELVRVQEEENRWRDDAAKWKGMWHGADMSLSVSKAKTALLEKEVEELNKEVERRDAVMQVNDASFAEDLAHLQQLLATVREEKSHLESAMSEATAKITALVKEAEKTRDETEMARVKAEEKVNGLEEAMAASELRLSHSAGVTHELEQALNDTRITEAAGKRARDERERESDREILACKLELKQNQSTIAALTAAALKLEAAVTNNVWGGSNVLTSLGLHLHAVDSAVTVDRVAEGSAAAGTRIRCGDRLEEVDGVKVTWKNVDEVEALLCGEAGSTTAMTCKAGEEMYLVSLLRGGGAGASLNAEGFISRVGEMTHLMYAWHVRMQQLQDELHAELESHVKKHKTWAKERGILENERAGAISNLSGARLENMEAVAQIQTLTKGMQHIQQQREACSGALKSLRDVHKLYMRQADERAHAVEVQIASVHGTHASMQAQITRLGEMVKSELVLKCGLEEIVDVMRKEAAETLAKLSAAEAQLQAASRKNLSLQGMYEQAVKEAEGLEVRINGMDVELEDMIKKERMHLEGKKREERKAADKHLETELLQKELNHARTLAKSAEEAAGAKLNLLQVQLNSQNQECRQKAAELLAVQEQHTETLKDAKHLREQLAAQQQEHAMQIKSKDARMRESIDDLNAAVKAGHAVFASVMKNRDLQMEAGGQPMQSGEDLLSLLAQEVLVCEETARHQKHIQELTAQLESQRLARADAQAEWLAQVEKLSMQCEQEICHLREERVHLEGIHEKERCEHLKERANIAAALHTQKVRNDLFGPLRDRSVSL
jgi:C-terminal processing protease CtpA/Prc